MTIYEKRFYEDFHKLVIIQGKILKELEKMNEPLVEVKVLDSEATNKNVKCKCNMQTSLPYQKDRVEE